MLSQARPADDPPSRAELTHMIAAGGFILWVYASTFNNLPDFFKSVTAGNPAWTKLLVSLLFGAFGVVLGMAVAAGSLRALRVMRFLLSMRAAGGVLVLLMSLVHIWPQHILADGFEVAISLALLVLTRESD